MADNSQVKYEDAAFQQALQGLAGHVENMRTAGQRVSDINEEIKRGMISGSSTIFQGKVSQWLEDYQAIMQSFDRLTEASGQAKQVLTKAEDEAAQHGGSWGGSAGDSVYNTLTPH